jgi:hypothetical protein
MIAQRRREREQAEADERGQSPQPGPQPAPSGSEFFSGALSGLGPQATAFGRGAGQALSFGIYDPAVAAAKATFEPGGLDGWQDRFRADRAHEQAQDQYEAAHYPTARTAGQVSGTLLSLAAGGPLSGGARIAGAAGITAREAATLMAAHGAIGAGLQTASDAAQGRPMSWRDELGAALGGAATGAAGIRLPPGRAGALGGAVTSATDDLLNGRPVSLQGVANGALAGRFAGGVPGIAGRAWSNGLSMQEKGVLGEQLGALRNRVNGRPTGVLAKKSRDAISGQNGKYWLPDRQVGDTRYEDKFGYKAELRGNQKLAQSALGPKFVLSHFTPDDIAKLVGLPSALVGTATARALPPPQR